MLAGATKMEISAASTAQQTKNVMTVHSSSGIQKSHDCDCDDKGVSRNRQADFELSRGAALQVFRTELRMSLKAQFYAVIDNGQSAYAAAQGDAAADDVADEALAVAKSIVDQSPTNAAKSMIRFRSSVSESLQVASRTVQTDADQKDLDAAATKIDEGVADLEEQAAATRESTTTALNIDTSARQRSVIKIRTQEGDVVRLSLYQATDLAASSSESVDGDITQQKAEIDFSSRSRMLVKVRGDLNEAEMGAIQNVLAQAQEMADAFFGGDIGAAFASASAFEFDAEQLSRVKMRFKMYEESSVAYSQVTNPVASPTIAEASSEPMPSAQVPSEVPTVVEVAEAVEPPARQAVPDDALRGFFEQVGSFLRAVSEGSFEGSGSTAIRYQYSESFKLSLLQSVINTVAPAEAGEASDAAVKLIDRMSDSESKAA